MTAPWLLMLPLLSAAPPAPADDPRIRSAVNKTGKEVDACIEKYLVEQPQARGSAKVVVTYAPTGKAVRADVSTKLPLSRRLASCLDRVARSWTLPALAGRSKLEVRVAVYPGARFALASPKASASRKAAARAPAPKKKPPLGEFTFQPGGFWNGDWKAQDGEPDPNDNLSSAEGGPELPGAPPENGPGTGVAE